MNGAAQCGQKYPGRAGRARRRSGRLLLVLLLARACALAPAGRCAGGSEAADRVPTEYEVKAAFLFNFARFVEWPPQTFASATTPIDVCVLGEDPFGDALNRVVAGKALGERVLVVRRGKHVRELNGCAILFVSQSERERVPDILQELGNAPVLTVGESADFAAQGGGVQFTLEDSHVRFLVNVDATERARLKVSSKLLSLAHVVHDQARRKN